MFDREVGRQVRSVYEPARLRDLIKCRRGARRQIRRRIGAIAAAVGAGVVVVHLELHLRHAYLCGTAQTRRRRFAMVWLANGPVNHCEQTRGISRRLLSIAPRDFQMCHCVHTVLNCRHAGLFCVST